MSKTIAIKIINKSNRNIIYYLEHINNMSYIYHKDWLGRDDRYKMGTFIEEDILNTYWEITKEFI